MASKAARNADLGKVSLKLQCFWRIEMAKRRVAAKRQLDTSGQIAFDVVDTSCLFLSDVRELVHRIQQFLIEPEGGHNPPDELLMLIRIVAMMIQEARGMIGLAMYSKMNSR